MKTDVGGHAALLDFEDLTVGYGRRIVGRALGGRLVAGRLTALIGRNGAGKSTLLRTLAGLLPPLGGHMAWGGRDAATLSLADMARLVAVVLTYRTDAGGLTAGEVVGLGRTPYTGMMGRLSATDAAAVRHALHLVGAERLGKRPIGRLSDGERQRVMVAKALAQATPAILLDEPTAFLDFAGRVGLLRLLRRLAHDEGRAILFSTHDVETALRLADDVWLLSSDGLCSGTIATLAANGRLSAFLSSPGLRFDGTTLRFCIGADGGTGAATGHAGAAGTGIETDGPTP